jgi:hypothetical protein
LYHFATTAEMSSNVIALTTFFDICVMFVDHLATTAGNDIAAIPTFFVNMSFLTDIFSPAFPCITLRQLLECRLNVIIAY